MCVVCGSDTSPHRETSLYADVCSTVVVCLVQIQHLYRDSSANEPLESLRKEVTGGGYFFASKFYLVLFASVICCHSVESRKVSAMSGNLFGGLGQGDIWSMTGISFGR